MILLSEEYASFLSQPSIPFLSNSIFLYLESLLSLLSKDLGGFTVSAFGLAAVD
jgi:hypothetical protein